MDKQKLEYFRNLLLQQRRQAIEDLRANRAIALEGNDGVEDSGEMSAFDLNRSTALDLANRQSQLIEEIDEALGRIEDGTYGQCSRCGKPLDEERLKAMPTAKYDAECQAAIEAAQGIETPSFITHACGYKTLLTLRRRKPTIRDTDIAPEHFITYNFARGWRCTARTDCDNSYGRRDNQKNQRVFLRPVYGRRVVT